MSNKEKDNGTNLSAKWIYLAIAAFVIGFGVYGYFKVSKWVRYAAIERYEKPISDYRVTNVYIEKDKYKKKGRGVNDDEEVDKEPQYYMEVSYKGKDYKLELEGYEYSKYIQNKGITLYYDSKGDEIFVAGAGGANLLVTALAAIVLLIAIVFFLLRLLFKSIKRKRRLKK